MYVPRPDEETRVEVMHALIRAHALGTWTLFDGEDLLTQHVAGLRERGDADSAALVARHAEG